MTELEFRLNLAITQQHGFHGATFARGIVNGDNPFAYEARHHDNVLAIVMVRCIDGQWITQRFNNATMETIFISTRDVLLGMTQNAT